MIPSSSKAIHSFYMQMIFKFIVLAPASPQGQNLHMQLPTQNLQ